MVLPSGLITTVKQIWTYDGPLQEAFCPQSITLVLNDDIDVSRGDMIIGPDNLPGASTDLRARVCWMHPHPLQPGRKYALRHTTKTVQAAITGIEDRIDMTTLEPEPHPPELALNDIGEVRFNTSAPLVFDGYAANRLTGSFILIEPGTNATVGAGMLLPPLKVVKPEYSDFAI
jgi:bifunctional enzyme CysN/CysC/sulfate adenylyltransferase subunit 1